MNRSKDVFHFKQFKVNHNKSAMKVGFDAILLGAWCNVDRDKNILDIGTGTGLIALMLAQKNHKANIFAIEPDFDSCSEAKFNFDKSPWSNRLYLENKSLQDFSKERKQYFDHIVCNPPFFSDGLVSKKTKVAFARHTIGLSHFDLLSNTKVLLSRKGKLSVILPKEEGELLLEQAKGLGFYLVRRCDVYTKSKIERLLITLSPDNDFIAINNQIHVYSNDGRYSGDYINMVKDFYLKM